jgi:hypothetical protein
MPDKRPTIAEAVTSFMVVFGSSPDIRLRAQSLIETLRQNPQWTLPDIEELKRLLAERLPPEQRPG